MTSTTWQAASTPPVLHERAVHVWRLAIDELVPLFDGFRRLLSDDEQDRAARFRFGADRDRYVLTRGVLRRLLGAYAGADPEHLRFEYAKNGKPRLESTRAPVHFNVSHAGNRALIAVASSGPVGVDVEKANRNVSETALAERFFSADEVDRLNALPPHMRRGAFLQCWTRKEAVIKAHGDGLSLPLDSFSVAFGPGVPAEIIRAEGQLAGIDWSLDAPTLEHEYAAAVCATWSAAQFHHGAFAAAQ